MPGNKILIPTGYEPTQLDIERKNKRAELLRSMSAQGAMRNDMRSFLQPLAVLAQAWRARQLEKEADAQQNQLSQDIQGNYQDARKALYESAAAGTDNRDLVAKFGANPYLQDDLEPYRKALAARLRDDQTLVQNGDQWQRKGTIQSGDFIGNKANNAVIRGPNGEMMVNPVKATASLAAQGIPMNDPRQPPTYSAIDPRMVASAQKVRRTRRKPDGYDADGIPLWQINGKWYDNPEGL